MRKRTKIIATIGPVTEDLKSLKILAEKGVNIFRLNFSHGTHKWHGEVIKRIKNLNKQTTESIAILLDTKGPEIRTGEVEIPLKLNKGDKIILTPDILIAKTSKKISVNYEYLSKDISIGEKILVDNGIMTFKVLEKKDKDIIIEVMEDGILESKRHLNLPGKEVSLDAITKKDWEDIDFGIKMKVDFIALSFVRSAKEIKKVKEYLKKKKAKIKIIAKIESFEAVKNLEEIVDTSSAVMVARGDLGAEIPFSEVPQVQKKIIELGDKYYTPIIVATHMLESMINNPIPTRAEVTDIFTAVEQKADCTMLSGETTVGEFPMKAVDAMVETIKETEIAALKNWQFRDKKVSGKRELISKMSAKIASDDDDLSAIIVLTRSGLMANLISNFRPKAPIYAFTNTPSTKRSVQILWGVKCFKINFSENPEIIVERAEKKILEKYSKLKNKKYVLIADFLVGEKIIPTLQIRVF